MFGLYIALVCKLYLIQTVVGQRVPDSPCPAVFRYELLDSRKRSGESVLKGVVTIESGPNFNVEVKYIFTNYVDANKTGRIELDEELGELAKRFETVDKATIRINLFLPATAPVPTINSIRLNGQVICRSNRPRSSNYTSVTQRFYLSGNNNGYRFGNKVQSEAHWRYLSGSNNHVNVPATKTPQGHRKPTPKPGTNGVLAPPRGPAQPSGMCGKPISKDLVPLIVNGKRTRSGDWPWLVALYKNREFICGSTLVTQDYIVTAAHCVYPEQTGGSRFVAHLGKFDLSREDTVTQIRQIKDIHIHPDYDWNSIYADIAILRLESPVAFTHFIMPACLWTVSEDRSRSVNTYGTVVGWGSNGNSTFTQTPYQVNMPMVPKDVCLDSNDNFRILVKNTTFCAGRRDGSGPCTGDSGSAFLISTYDRSGNRRWFLRGVVSAALAKYGGTGCDLDNFVIFTDIAKLSYWLLQYIPVGF